MIGISLSWKNSKSLVPRRVGWVRWEIANSQNDEIDSTPRQRNQHTIQGQSNQKWTVGMVQGEGANMHQHPEGHLVWNNITLAWHGFVASLSRDDGHKKVYLGGTKQWEPTVGEESTGKCDVLFGCVGSDGAANNGDSLNEGHDVADKEDVQHGKGWDL